MKKLCFIAGVLLAALLLNACQTTELSTGSVQQAPLRTSPVDVVSAYISPQAITPQDVDISQGNLFDNGGFEAGLAGWTGCDTGAIAESSDAYEGSKALKVTAGNCFYRSVEVSVAQELVLSCYVRLESGSGWTGIQLSAFRLLGFEGLAAGSRYYQWS